MSIIILALTLMLALLANGQQTNSIDASLTDILKRFQSKDLRTREAAFDDLCELWSQGITANQDTSATIGLDSYRRTLNSFFAAHPDQAERVKLGLIRLLRTENNAMKSARPGSQDEDDGEYVFALTQAVSALRDERAIPVLAAAISRSGADLLQFGDKALGPVLEQLKSQDALDRAKALEAATSILKSKKDDASRGRLTDLIRSSLKDPSPVVRGAAAREIACLDNREDFVRDLEELAKTDPTKFPGRAIDGGDGNEFYPVRFDARSSLRTIKNNQKCGQPAGN
jgi:hypothetical protein